MPLPFAQLFIGFGIRYEAVSIDRVLAAMGDARGVAETFTVYATQAGAPTLDDEGKHGPFAKILLQEISRPGLEIHTIFKNVREGVMKITNGRQIPWFVSSTSKNFYFLPTNTNNFESPDLNIMILDAAKNHPIPRM